MPNQHKDHEWLVATPIAHRGLHQTPQAPENSLAAFKNAIENNCPIELDIQKLSDGNVAVFHDADLERLTGNRGEIGSQTVAEIKKLNLLGTAERIPLLHEVLHLVDGKVPLLIEVKNDTSEIGSLETALLEIISDYKGPFAVQSFNPSSLSWIRQRAPRIFIGQLSCNYSWLKKLPASLELHNLLQESRSDFVAYHVDELPTEATTLVRQKKIPLLAWTIKTPEQQSKARQYADNYIFEGIHHVPQNP